MSLTILRPNREYTARSQAIQTNIQGQIPHSTPPSSPLLGNMCLHINKYIFCSSSTKVISNIFEQRPCLKFNCNCLL